MFLSLVFCFAFLQCFTTSIKIFWKWKLKRNFNIPCTWKSHTYSSFTDIESKGFINCSSVEICMYSTLICKLICKAWKNQIPNNLPNSNRRISCFVYILIVLESIIVNYYFFTISRTPINITSKVQVIKYSQS